MSSSVWDEITYARISNFIAHSIYNGGYYLSMLRLKLVHVSKGPLLASMNKWFQEIDCKIDPGFTEILGTDSLITHLMTKIQLDNANT